MFKRVKAHAQKPKSRAQLQTQGCLGQRSGSSPTAECYDQDAQVGAAKISPLEKPGQADTVSVDGGAEAERPRAKECQSSTRPSHTPLGTSVCRGV